MFEVHITNYNSQTQSYTKSIEIFSTESQARTRFHRAQADGISNENVAWCKAHVETQQGAIVVPVEYIEKNQPSI